jgi:tetratricopeptide (TPR) repeat protein
LDPNFPLGHLRLGQAYVGKKQYELGIADLKKFATLSGNSAPSLANLGIAYAAAGRPADAQKALDQLIELSKTRYVSPFYIAGIYAGLGQKDKAFGWLGKSYEERSLLLAFVKVMPDFDTLRSDPRFADLLRRMNLQP